MLGLSLPLAGVPIGQFRTPFTRPERQPERHLDNNHKVIVDNGCKVSAKCTECPLPTCVDDFQGGFRSAINHMVRDPEIQRLAEKGVAPTEIARRMGMSKRNIYRVLAEVGND